MVGISLPCAECGHHAFLGTIFMAQRRADKIGASAPAKRGGQDLADGGGRDAGADERWRLRTLREDLILDTEPEPGFDRVTQLRSEEHTSELQSLLRTSYAVSCLKKKEIKHITTQ